MTNNKFRSIVAARNYHTVEDQEKLSAEDQLVSLMELYETPIYNFLLSILRDRDLALDCAQDTFLRAYDMLRTRRSINRSWLYTVARNRAIDEFRRKKHFEADEGLLEEVPSGEGPSGSGFEVRAVMDKLPSMDREVLYLFEIAGFKTHEIGEMLGIRSSAVRQRLARARQKFRALHSWETGDVDSPAAKRD